MVNFQRKINFLPWRRLAAHKLQRRYCLQFLSLLVLISSVLWICFLGLKWQIRNLQQQKVTTQQEIQQLAVKIKQLYLHKLILTGSHQQEKLIELLSCLPAALPTSVNLTQIQQQQNHYVIAGVTQDAMAAMQIIQGLQNLCKIHEVKLLALNKAKSGPVNLFKLQVNF